jgi:hypothetical protein
LCTYHQNDLIQRTGIQEAILEAAAVFVSLENYLMMIAHLQVSKFQTSPADLVVETVLESLHQHRCQGVMLEVEFQRGMGSVEIRQTYPCLVVCRPNQTPVSSRKKRKRENSAAGTGAGGGGGGAGGVDVGFGGTGSYGDVQRSLGKVLNHRRYFCLHPGCLQGCQPKMPLVGLRVNEQVL